MAIVLLGSTVISACVWASAELTNRMELTEMRKMKAIKVCRNLLFEK